MPDRKDIGKAAYQVHYVNIISFMRRASIGQLILNMPSGTSMPFCLLSPHSFPCFRAFLVANKSQNFSYFGPPGIGLIVIKAVCA
jgi:hypothetical protein